MVYWKLTDVKAFKGNTAEYLGESTIASFEQEKNMSPQNAADIPTIERIDAAYRTSAKVVRLFGDRYLPLFERMHKEYELKKASLDLRSIAFRLSEEANGS